MKNFREVIREIMNMTFRKIYIRNISTGMKISKTSDLLWDKDIDHTYFNIAISLV